MRSRSLTRLLLAGALMLAPACGKSASYREGYDQGKAGPEVIGLSLDVMDEYCDLMAGDPYSEWDAGDYYEGCVDGFRDAS